MSHILPLEVSLIEAGLYAVEQLGQDFFLFVLWTVLRASIASISPLKPNARRCTSRTDASWLLQQ